MTTVAEPPAAGASEPTTTDWTVAVKLVAAGTIKNPPLTFACAPCLLSCGARLASYHGCFTMPLPANSASAKAGPAGATMHTLC